MAATVIAGLLLGLIGTVVVAVRLSPALWRLNQHFTLYDDPHASI